MRGAPSMKSQFGRRDGGLRASSVLVAEGRDDDRGLDALQAAGMATVPDARPRYHGVSDYSGGALQAAAQVNMATFLPGIAAPRRPGPRRRGMRGAPPIDEGAFGNRLWPSVLAPQGMRTTATPRGIGPQGRPQAAYNLPGESVSLGLAPKSTGTSTSFKLGALLLLGLAFL